MILMKSPVELLSITPRFKFVAVFIRYGQISVCFTTGSTRLQGICKRRMSGEISSNNFLHPPHIRTVYSSPRQLNSAQAIRGCCNPEGWYEISSLCSVM